MTRIPRSACWRQARGSLRALRVRAPLVISLIAAPGALTLAPITHAAEPAVLDASMQPLAKAKARTGEDSDGRLITLPVVQAKKRRTWSDGSPDRSGPEYQRQSPAGGQAPATLPLGLDAIGIDSLVVDDLSIERLGMDALGIDSRGLDSLVDRTLHDVGTTASGIGVDASALLGNGARP